MNPKQVTDHPSSWYTANMSTARTRAPLAADLDVDVCIIGGGLAGLTVARELTRRGWSIALLEAKRIAWSASGHNTGIVAPGFAERIDRIVGRIGLERAKPLWDLSVAGMEYVRAAGKDARMPAADPAHGHLVAERIDNEQGLRGRVDLIRDKLGHPVELWPTDKIRDALGSPHYFQGVHFPRAFQIHPLNYALGLAAAAEAAGARIFEHTRAIRIDADGVRKRIVTPRGRVRAGQIVLAGGAHLADLVPAVAGTVLPIQGLVAVTAPLGDRMLQLTPFRGSVADPLAASAHRLLGEDRLLWSGRNTTRIGNRARRAQDLRGDIGRVYPQLRELDLASTWSGTMAYAVHKMPQIGELVPGLWLANAFASHGLNTSAMAGTLIASAIADGDDRWRLFSPYGLVWTAGRFGRVAMEIVLRSRRGRTRLEEVARSIRGAFNGRMKAAAASRDMPVLTGHSLGTIAHEPRVADPAPAIAQASAQKKPARGKRTARSTAKSRDGARAEELQIPTTRAADHKRPLPPRKLRMGAKPPLSSAPLNPSGPSADTGEREQT